RRLQRLQGPQRLQGLRGKEGKEREGVGLVAHREQKGVYPLPAPLALVVPCPLPAPWSPLYKKETGHSAPRSAVSAPQWPASLRAGFWSCGNSCRVHLQAALV